MILRLPEARGPLFRTWQREPSSAAGMLNYLADEIVYHRARATRGKSSVCADERCFDAAEGVHGEDDNDLVRHSGLGGWREFESRDSM